MRKPPWKRRQDQSGRKALDLLTGFFEVVHEIRIGDGRVDRPSQTQRIGVWRGERTTYPQMWISLCVI
jgi:hypothetical protein